MSALTVTVGSIADEMISSIGATAVADLRRTDTAAAIRSHFDPIRVETVGSRQAGADDCSTDGLYDSVTSSTPTILYADDVAPERVRFTLLHELGHHLLVTQCSNLLDVIDDLAGSRADPSRLEEKVCHEFAGRILVPGDLIARLKGAEILRPDDLIELHQQCNVSWEALAVRMATGSSAKIAIVLVRKPGIVGFSAASGHFAAPWWPRGSALKPGGPLDRSLKFGNKAKPDIYRYDLAYSAQLFCDSKRVHDGLAIAVLSERASDHHFEILEDPEPIWKDRDVFCERCNEERTEGWCDVCKGPHCPQCGRCGCSRPASNPICPGCGLMSPKRSGAPYCFTCEADGLA